MENQRREMRTINVLTRCYLALSVLTVVAIAVLRNDEALVNTAVWVRATIVAVSAALLALFAAKATRGSRGAYRRLRIVSAVMLVAVVVIVAIPGDFPVWLKVEQAVCGVFLAGIVLIANSARVRSLFEVRA
jgi:hypothetical protein